VDLAPGETAAPVTITARDDAAAEGDETAVFAIRPVPGAYDLLPPGTVTLTIRDNDLTGGPAVTSSVFVYDAGPPQRVRFTFSQDVATSVGANDFTVTGPGGSVPFSFAYDGIADTATLSFTGTLANGNYVARAVAAGITNASGAPMAADSLLSFFVLAGDVDRNRSVNGSDFAILAGNFGKTGQAYAAGDLNGDGSVGGGDFAILAGNFGRVLPAPPPGPSASSVQPSAQRLTPGAVARAQPMKKARRRGGPGGR
jgi:hypothetical protein